MIMVFLYHALGICYKIENEKIIFFMLYELYIEKISIIMLLL